MNEQEKIIKQIISSISKNTQQLEGNYIIGIDGYSCGGKTSLTENLRQWLEVDYPVSIFHIDDHIRTREHRYSTGYEQWYELYHLQWDTAYIKEALLKPLKNNSSQVKLQYYNKDKDTIIENTSKIIPKSVVIIEGVFLQRSEWRELFDYMIFVHCPREIRFKREIVRSNYKGSIDELVAKYKERYWAAEDYYERIYKPMGTADLIVDNYNQCC